MGNKLVKHWNFKGKHTGLFFGIQPTGKNVNIDGVTLVRMDNGRIVEEQDFYKQPRIYAATWFNSEAVKTKRKTFEILSK